MKFQKSLQKREVEKRAVLDTAATVSEINPIRRGIGRGNNPANFPISDLKIGTPIVEYPPTSESDDAKIRENTNSNGTDSEVARASSIQTRLYRDCTVEGTNVNQRLVAITQPHSAYCEEYRRLRTHIIHRSQLKKLRSIVITSIGPSEGKSVTALNLAWLLAQTDGLSALIIDGDMRRPSTAEYLGIETEIGFSDILAGKATLKDAIVRVNPVGMHLVPAGNSRDDIAEMLSGPRFNKILWEAYETFDFVIIDAPPISLFADATVLINCSDGALLVVCADEVPYKDVHRMVDALPKERFLGVVLNKSEDTLMSRQYYDYPYYRTD